MMQTISSTPSDQPKQMVAKGAYLERTYPSALPSGGAIGLNEMAEAVKALVAEN